MVQRPLNRSIIHRKLFFMEGTIMTPETKKSIYWTAGVLAALVVLVAILWVAGVFEVAPVQ